MTKELEENEKYYTIFKVITTFFIYLVIGIFAVFTIFVSKVNAETSPYGWAEDLETPLYVEYHGWSSSTAHSSKATTTWRWYNYSAYTNNSTYYNEKWLVVNSSNFANDNNGLSIRISTNETLKSNYLYSWQVGLCSNVSLANVNYNKISYTISGSEQYTYGTRINVSSRSYQDMATTGSYVSEVAPWSNVSNGCKIYSGLVSGTSGSNNLYLKLVGSTNSGKFWLMGYKVQELGMWDENIRNIMSSVISSSGLATASSVQQVQQATDEIQQQVEEVNEQQQETNNMLNDDSVDNPSNSINGMASNNTSNGVISDLLLLPVRLYQALINNINGTCTTFNLGSLFGHNLVMPCINISSFLGSAIYGTIDVFISGFFILTIRKKFVDIFNNITSLKTGGNELE